MRASQIARARPATCWQEAGCERLTAELHRSKAQGAVSLPDPVDLRAARGSEAARCCEAAKPRGAAAKGPLLVPG